MPNYPWYPFFSGDRTDHFTLVMITFKLLVELTKYLNVHLGLSVYDNL